MKQTKLITFTEAKQFKLFLEDNLKGGKKGFDNCRYDFDEFLKDAQNSLYQGRQSYELKGFETKSGNPECFIFTDYIEKSGNPECFIFTDYIEIN